MTGEAKAAMAKRNAEILALAQHLPPGRIAERIPGVSRARIAGILYEARRGGARIPRYDAAGKHAAPRSPSEPRSIATYVFMSSEVVAALTPEAARRKLTPKGLARELLTRIVEDNLIDAVLDDGGAR
jgi:hypothetical protein